MSLEPSDEERLAAATAELSATGLVGLSAWDITDSTTVEGGVEFVLCGWTGQTAGSAIYRSRWTVESDGAGAIVAAEAATEVTDERCLNTDLLDSAVRTVQRYDELISAVLADPAMAGTSVEDADLLAPEELTGTLETIETWTDEDVTFRGSSHANPIPDSLVMPLLTRSIPTDDGRGLLELATCRDQNPEYGRYENDQLVDRGQPDDPGPNSVIAYRLMPDPTSPTGWRVEHVASLAWATCGSAQDWPVAASRWRVEADDFEPVPSVG